MVRRSSSLWLSSLWLILTLVAAGLVACTAVPAETPTPITRDEFVFGVILVGPRDDHGWSEAHYNVSSFSKVRCASKTASYTWRRVR